MNNCPCCSYPMLRHIRKSEVFWYCRHCWQEMPNLNSTPTSLLQHYAQSLESAVMHLTPTRA